MKKYLILIIVLFLITGCTKENNTVGNKDTKINVIKDNIEYGDDVLLSDLLKIENGSLNKDSNIDSLVLGEKDVIINYINNNNKKDNYAFKVNVVDTTKPMILHKTKYTIKKGSNINLLDKIICGDNYDRDLVCSIKGEYDVNTSADYNLFFTATDSSGNVTESPFTLSIKDTTQNSTYTNNDIIIDDFIKNYKTDKTMIGIDVSSWQGEIDWNTVKNAGVEFAMIRIGHGCNDDGTYSLDKYFFNNLKGAKEAGIKVGIYYYSEAVTKEDAINQAKWIISNLNGEKLDLPISFDWESWSDFNNMHLNYVDLNLIAKSFMDEIKKSGYDAIIYGSANYMEKIWNISFYPTWLAYYTDNNDYSKDFYIWQKGNTGKVQGINAYVDLDILYKK